MGRSHSGGEKGERRTVEVRKEAHRPRREPPSTAPQLCSASEQGRNTPAHSGSTLVPRTPVMLPKKENSLESLREPHRLPFSACQPLLQAWLAAVSDLSASPLSLTFPGFPVLQN